jgi:hypothetical protein
MNPNIKTLLAAAGIFTIAVSANVVAKSLYTNTKLGTDKKILIASGVIGIGATFLMVKWLKK